MFFKSGEKVYSPEANQKVQCHCGFIIRPRHGSASSSSATQQQHSGAGTSSSHAPDIDSALYNLPPSAIVSGDGVINISADFHTPSPSSQPHPTSNPSKASFSGPNSKNVEQKAAEGKGEKKKGGCEVVFFCQLEFSGQLVTFPMQVRHMQDVLGDLFEKLKERVEAVQGTQGHEK